MTGSFNSRRNQAGAIVNGSSTATVLRGVTVVDTRDGSLAANQDVTTADGRITGITTADAQRAHRHIVDFPGKYLVPRYMDKHAHPLGDGDRTGTLQLMLTRGITGVRQISGSIKLLKQRREGALPMPTAPPDVVQMPGAVLNHAASCSPGTTTPPPLCPRLKTMLPRNDQ